ncbi:Zinc finger protein 283 [Portunus trituberculatus]|uniref:Zinc finger protein 283 n=2 Tax=Portunus trituberculatus TaxID=210409 RepID=A0A5B7H225_PORTR|nr:Zinc finger protein 283 [Portunus trituberculatus]
MRTCHDSPSPKQTKTITPKKVVQNTKRRVSSSSNVPKKKFKCDECGKKFVTRKSMLQHSRVHSDVREFECVWCGMQFKWRSNLLRHMKNHSLDKKHKCHKCGKGFSRKSHLAQHFSIHHPGMKKRL